MDEEVKGQGPRSLKEEVPEPTVGRIVHFYTRNPSRHYNGQAQGPYPAIVAQTCGGLMVNLKVLPSFGEAYDAGSVPHLSQQTAPESWWVWPPRIETRKPPA